jgi:hypothetical protein
MLLVTAIVLAWILLVLAAVVLCVGARRSDEDVALGELAPVIDFPPAA